MNIVVKPDDNPIHLRRCLWSIARKGFRPEWKVYVHNADREVRKVAERFRGCYLLDFENNLPKTDRFVVMDGATIVWGDALEFLQIEPAADIVAASVYKLPAGLALDDYGANITEKLVEYCRKDPVLTKEIRGPLDRLSLVRKETYGVQTDSVVVSSNALALTHTN